MITAMRSLPCLSLLILALSSGCTLWFSGDDGGDDVCDFAAEEPAIAEAPRRDPGNLTCQSFGYPCDDACGPCPAVADLAPIPTWPYCGSPCEQLGESACEADPACRVIKDASCAIGESVCLTDFLGCFPIDEAPDDTVDCATADAWDCSRSNQCTAYHAAGTGACPPNTECGRPFELCMPEGQHPGACVGMIACDEPAPACPSGTTPGIENGCYTRACIPLEYCAPAS